MSLSNDLLTVFNNMQNITENGNKYFADNVTDKIVSYLNTLTIQTENVGGTVPTGAFSLGTGSTSVSIGTVPKETCKTSIKSFSDTMANWETEEDIKDNTYCAYKLSEAIDNMFKATQVSFSVTGTLVTPSGVTSVLSGTVNGTMKTSTALDSLKSSIKTAFEYMETHESSATNGYVAEQIANAVSLYATSCTVDLTGTGAISGTSGTASIS